MVGGGCRVLYCFAEVLFWGKEKCMEFVSLRLVGCGFGVAIGVGGLLFVVV